jgi:hypothetical protein
VKSRILYRISAVLILLFDLGHSAAFPWSDPAWGVDTAAMRSSRFHVPGFSRTYWDFYVGFGLYVSVLLLLAAVLAWQLGGLPVDTRPRMRGMGWALAVCFAAITVLSWRYFFAIPIVFGALITVTLVVAAWLSARDMDTPVQR